jgi:serine/threonine protein kinase
MTTPTKPFRGASDQDVVQAALETDYEVLEEIGRGGMATVYRARERMLDREVAIKVLPFTLAFDESLVERFLREARTSARLEHPHIIPIHRVGQSGQVTYFVMKLLRGQSLSARLAARGRGASCSRRPGPWGTRTATASCTATSNPTTSCSTRPGAAW